jgi:hypothetical protein
MGIPEGFRCSFGRPLYLHACIFQAAFHIGPHSPSQPLSVKINKMHPADAKPAIRSSFIVDTVSK